MHVDVIDVSAACSRVREPWSPRIIASLNGQHVKIARLDGAFQWHAHQDADEMFLVIEGAFTMEFRDSSVEVGQGEMIVVPRGVEHRPVAAAPCAVLLCEPAGTVNTGDAARSERSSAGKWLEED